MREIKLTQGKIALVDDEDYERLNQWKWCAKKHRNTFYAYRGVWKNGRVEYMSMHREVMGLVTNGGGLIDHKDQNGLHNWKDNLRIASLSINAYNCKMNIRNTSGFRGVIWHKAAKSFIAVIGIEKKKKHLGCFPSKVDVAKAYDEAAIQYYGKDAILNFPEDNHAQM